MEYLLGDFHTAEEMYPALLDHAKSIYDKADVYSVMAGQYEVQVIISYYDKAITY